MLHFPGQRENETVLHVVHRHWFNLAIHFSLLFVFVFVFFGSFYLFAFLFPETFADGRYQLFLFIQNSALLYLWLYGFLLWIDYYFDVWIITSERIINIEQKGLFVRTISEVGFSRVQDISTNVSSLIPTILNFGDLSVQTAAESERILFRQVSDPNHLKDEIMRLVKRDRLRVVDEKTTL